MKISIIIPAYNHEEYIIEAINSVLNQSYHDFEIIIINDGSTDSTEQRIFSIHDQRIQYISQKNSGAHSAINRGISLAQGEYISILNSDDIYLPKRLETCLNYLDKNTNYSVVMSTVEGIDNSGTPVKQSVTPQVKAWLDWYMGALPFFNEDKFYPSAFAKNIMITTSNLFVRRKVFQECGGFKALRYTHDWDMLLRLSRRYQIHLIKEDLLQYRMHSENTVHERDSDLKVQFEVNWLIVENLKELNADVPFSEILELLKNNQYLSFETMFFLSLMKDQPAFYDLINFQNPQMNQSLQSLARTTTFFEREQSIVALQAQVHDLQTMKLGNFFYKLINYIKLIFSKYLTKLKYLYNEARHSFEEEGFSRVVRRTINYIFYGKGVLNKKELINRKQHLENVIQQNVIKKNEPTFFPFKSVYYVSNIPDGGALKYITDLINIFETPYLRFVQIQNREELNAYKDLFKKDDIFLFQYLFHSDLTFEDITDVKKNYGIKLVIPRHDFYFLQKKTSDFYQLHNGVYSNYNNKLPLSPPVFDLLKTADVLIYPSNFVKNIFDSIFVFNNAKLSKHIDYKVHDFLAIPKVEKTINIGIINNISIYKGADYYPKLFSIKKYKGLHIQYHIFGTNEIESSNVVFHGPYIEDEIFLLLKKNNIHGLIFLNKWGETYSYSLTKGINSGLPILYSNLGAYIERLRNKQKFFPIHNIKNIKVDMQKMLEVILQKNGRTLNNTITQFEKEIPELYSNLFSKRKNDAH